MFGCKFLYCAIIKDKPLSRWIKYFVNPTSSAIMQSNSINALKHKQIFARYNNL